MMRHSIVLALLLCGAAASAEETLWSEGGKGLPKNAPINIQSFIKLAHTLGPAVVNVVALQTGEDVTPPGEPRQPGSGPPNAERRRGRGQGTGFVIHRSRTRSASASGTNTAPRSCNAR